jgi:RND family efflux transporter MFP subunit
MSSKHTDRRDRSRWRDQLLASTRSQKRTNKFALRCFGICLVAIELVLLPSCGRHDASPAPALPTADVSVQKIEEKPHVAAEEVVGTVRPKLHSVIEAKVSGRIEKMLVTPGQKVKADELLAQLDVREIQAKRDQALAVRQQTESELKRYQKLRAEQVITPAEFEAVQSRYQVAVASATEAETMLGYAKITAPFAGVVTRKLADVGDLAAPGKPLIELEDPHTLRFEAPVPEAIISRVSLGAKLSVRIMSKERDAMVSEIAPSAEPDSRTFLVKLDLPPAPDLRAGQFGRVEIPVSETNVLRAPASAVVERGQMELVFVVTNGHAELRLVKTGRRFGNEIELLSGVSAGEKVVTNKPASLVDGQPVKVRP